jgi:hypothetical protein
MKAITYLILNHDEVNEQIPYVIICETMGGARWNTSKRKRLMKQHFTESEIEATYRLYKQAYDWYLRKWVPDEVKMAIQTYALWLKLANFCCEI